jgi:hypothetical protein
MEQMPFYYRIIRGAIGRKFVIKHYKGGKIVKTRFPDMRGIVASEKQKVRRDLFREAVVWAKWVIADEERKLAFRSTLPRKKRKKVYQAALQMYIKMRGNKQWLRKVLGMLEMQGVQVCGDVRRKLAVMAVVESGKSEISNRQLSIGNGQWRKEMKCIQGNLLYVKSYELKGSWSIIWQKSEDLVIPLQYTTLLNC